MLDIIADMHCHTIASSHAFSTVLENIQAAKKRGLKLIAITDHGPALSDSPHPYYFFNLRVLPRQIDGVYLLKGIEANIIDYDGNVDIPEDFKDNFEWVIASMHVPVLEPGTRDDHTRAWLGVCKNKYIDVIGHSGTEIFKCDYECVIKAFKANNKIVEINSSSFKIRDGAVTNCREIARLCKKYEVPIIIDSDCHFALNIGQVEDALKMLSEIEFPEKLIINTNFEKLVKNIKQIRGRDILK
ncbi:MAG: phosphatase [Oscillospiraceae bacterium]|nr:phosphatase [Oscillospiraceae bacterium]